MIESIQNPKIKKYLKLKNKKYRNKYKLFLLENHKIMELALEHKLVYEVLTSNPTQEGTLVSDVILKEFIQNNTPTDTIYICKMIKILPLENEKVLALNYLQDPGNVGTLIRSACSFGYTNILLHGVDKYHYKVIEASKGAIFSVNVIQVNSLVPYFDGYQTIGTFVNSLNSIPYKEFTPDKKHMLILGNEGAGIDPDLLYFIEKRIYIPINFESLNVGVAGAILMSHYSNLET